MISANTGAGVSIQGGASSGAAILGNLIGTDRSGTFALGNGADGVDISGMSAVTIGGTTAAARNIISANAGAGIGLLASDTGELIEGNFIGTDSHRLQPAGQRRRHRHRGRVGEQHDRRHGLGAGNTIAFSTGIGVDVERHARAPATRSA